MYVDLGKFIRIGGYLFGAAIILLGVVLVIASKTADEQTAGTVTAIFGLLLTWFIAWLGRE